MKETSIKASVNCSISHADLLRRLADEISLLGWMALDVQETSSLLASMVDPDATTIKKLQKIDVMTQMLEDLGCLLHWLATQDEFVTHNANYLTHQIRLTELVTRIVHGIPTEEKDYFSSGDVALF